MKINKSFLLVLMIIVITSITGCDKTVDEDKVNIAVSIVPQEAFVKAVGGDLVNVVTMIPPGYSPANYEPSPKQLIDLSESQVYFSIGVATESANILSRLNTFNSEIKIVSLSNKVDDVYPPIFLEGHHHDSDSNDDHEEEKLRDPHIWLSPKRVIVMIEVIRDELILLDSENEDIYRKNANHYITKLNKLNEEIIEIFNGIEDRSFIMYHPALGYFADDYNLDMYVIESDGKEPMFKKIQEVIDTANNENINIIFYQKEFDSQQAETIASGIDGKTIEVAPLSGDYIENLKSIANIFREVLN